MSTEVMPDGLHPSAKGYQLWADAIRDDVKRLMQ
jgi:lysophospholipase L1-like esterase